MPERAGNGSVVFREQVREPASSQLRKWQSPGGVLDFHISTGGQSFRGLSFGLLKSLASAAFSVDTYADYLTGADSVSGKGGV